MKELEPSIVMCMKVSELKNPIEGCRIFVCADCYSEVWWSPATIKTVKASRGTLDGVILLCPDCLFVRMGERNDITINEPSLLQLEELAKHREKER